MAAWPRRRDSVIPPQSNTDALLSRIDRLIAEEKQKIEEACLHIGRQYASSTRQTMKNPLPHRCTPLPLQTRAFPVSISRPC